MRKKILCFVCMTLLVLATGCKKEDIKITAKKANKNNPQLIVFESGKIQSTLVQKFDQDYYDLKELKSYLETQLKEYNTSNNANVKLNSVERSKDKVIAVFDYKNISEYTKCNVLDSLDAKFMSAKEAKSDDDVPNKLKKYGKSKTKSKSDAIDSDYKVVVLSAKEGATDKQTYEVTVDGDVEFVSNVEKVDDNTVKVSDLSKKAVIVFEP